MRTTSPTRQPPGTRRRQILDAALNCFLESGFEGATIEDIQTASKASHGSIYHHFGSKSAIAITLYEEGVDAYLNFVREATKDCDNARDGLHVFIRAHLEWSERNGPLALYLTRMATAEVSADAAERIVAMNHRSFDAVSAWIEPFVRRGEIAQLPTDLYFALLLGPTIYHNRQRLLGRTEIAIDEVVRVLADAAWKSLRAE